MKFRQVGFALMVLGLSSISLSAQTLFKFGKHKVSKQEFVAAYQKNNTESIGNHEAVEEYLDLYALFKMRLQDGYDHQVTSSQDFQNEFNTYKEQLVNSFVYDRLIEDKLLNEAVSRSHEERLLAHILFSIDRPQDSTTVKERAEQLYDEINSGVVTFEEVARLYSSDNGSSEKGGLVGYVTAMSVVYEVENALYTTPKGAISKPFKSPFGYHIVKNLDVRPAIGKVQVAQILIPKSEGASLAENVLIQLKQGADFDNLVKLYSKDAFSVQKNGILEPFGVGVMQESFEKAAFALEKKGDISEVVTTDYGFHILKLIDKIALPEDTILRKDLSHQIHRDGRSKLVRQEIFEELLTKYNYHFNEGHYKTFKDQFLLGTTNEFILSDYENNKNVLFKLNNTSYSVADFMNHIYAKTNGRVFGARHTFIEQMFKTYTEQLVIDLEARQLEKHNTEFANLLKEYKEGMVIFSVMDQNVWSKSHNNEEALQKYYETHADQYTFGPGFEGVIYTGDTRQNLQMLKEKLLLGEDFQQALNDIDAGRGVVRFKRDLGKFNYSDYTPTSVENLKNDSFSDIYQVEDGRYQMIYVNKQIPQVINERFSDVKGAVSVDFQKTVEEEWNTSLKKKYPLKINQKVLNSISK